MNGARFPAAAACALAAAVCATLLPAASAQDQQNPFCLKPGEETSEIYGPTDIGATLASPRLSVAVNPEGTLSVMRWPSRSYYEQLRYFTIDRDLPRLGLAPNEGAFSGLSLLMRDGSERMVWLRDLRVRQRYVSADSDSVSTRYSSRDLRLRLEIADVTPARGDVLMRRHVMRLGDRSPVRSATLIAFANLNPTASKHPLIPTEDWCDENRATDLAIYDSGADALVYSISELDQSLGATRSVAVAIGASRATVGHQVGADSYTEAPAVGAGPESAYDDAGDGKLSGNDALGPTEVDAALAIPIGRAPVTVTFAAGEDAAEATAMLDRVRQRSPARAARRQRRQYLRWLEQAPLPDGAPAAVERLARRSLVSLRQAVEERAGAGGDLVAIVASLSTQSPYFLDWIRDGAFFNEALDLIGHHELVTRHNRFYVEVQHRLEEGAPPGSPLHVCQGPTPDGNWFMTNYADGGDAGVFTWEIDEAAFGLWTLWRHHQHLRRAGEAGAYLQEVYPAIRRTGDFLVAFRDPLTGLPPGTACEDDNLPRPGQPTMHSSGTVLMALRAAESAASELGRAGDAARYAARRAELEQAIDTTYGGGNGAWTEDFGDGGWALWPERVRPYGDPRSRAQGEVVWANVAPSFAAPEGARTRGAYEAKALLGLAHLYRETDPARMSRVRRGLRWIAEVQARYQRTGILGEAWQVRNGRVISIVAQPHVWAQVLFYLTALEAYGKAPFEAAQPGTLMRARRR